MPELPEVETVRRTLEIQIKGRTIKGVEIFYSKMLSPDENSFKEQLIGETFNKFCRYGKYLIFIFDHVAIISHLRMEGKFFIKNQLAEREKHEHIIFHLDNNTDLRYHDTRKFGIMKLIPSTNLEVIMQDESLHKLGLEANSESLDANYLYEKLHKLTTPIKTSLLNQEIICGLGNIYVDEVLFRCGLNPKMDSCKVTMADCNNIVINSKKVLTEAIKQGGTTIRSYTSSLGVTGLFQLQLLVHTKENTPCCKCNTKILKTRVGGRGTYYCPKCQKNRPHLIGITGGVASGKTNVVNYIKEQDKNSLFIDTDILTHEILNSDKVIAKIKETFGPDVIVNSQIDRNKLGNIVFNDEKLKEELNNIMHNLIYEAMIKRIGSYTGTVYVEIPLLFEAKWDKYVDEIWVIMVSKETQIARLTKRNNLTVDEALSRINSQMDSSEKLKLIAKIQKEKPVYLIDNEQALCYTYKTVDKLLK